MSWKTTRDRAPDSTHFTYRVHLYSASVNLSIWLKPGPGWHFINPRRWYISGIATVNCAKLLSAQPLPLSAYVDYGEEGCCGRKEGLAYWSPHFLSSKKGLPLPTACWQRPRCLQATQCWVVCGSLMRSTPATLLSFWRAGYVKIRLSHGVEMLWDMIAFVSVTAITYLCLQSCHNLGNALVT